MLGFLTHGILRYSRASKRAFTGPEIPQGLDKRRRLVAQETWRIFQRFPSADMSHKKSGAASRASAAASSRPIKEAIDSLHLALNRPIALPFLGLNIPRLQGSIRRAQFDPVLLFVEPLERRRATLACGLPALIGHNDIPGLYFHI